MTSRQKKIRETGLAKARQMSREYSITSAQRRQTMIYVKATLILMGIAIIQTLYILL